MSLIGRIIKILEKLDSEKDLDKATMEIRKMSRKQLEGFANKILNDYATIKVELEKRDKLEPNDEREYEDMYG